MAADVALEVRQVALGDAICRTAAALCEGARPVLHRHAYRGIARQCARNVEGAARGEIDIAGRRAKLVGRDSGRAADVERAVFVLLRAVHNIYAAAFTIAAARIIGDGAAGHVERGGIMNVNAANILVGIVTADGAAGHGDCAVHVHIEASRAVLGITAGDGAAGAAVADGQRAGSGHDDAAIICFGALCQAAVQLVAVQVNRDGGIFHAQVAVEVHVSRQPIGVSVGQQIVVAVGRIRSSGLRAEVCRRCDVNHRSRGRRGGEHHHEQHHRRPRDEFFLFHTHLLFIWFIKIFFSAAGAVGHGEGECEGSDESADVLYHNNINV